MTLLSREEPSGSVQPLHYILQSGLAQCPQQRPLSNSHVNLYLSPQITGSPMVSPRGWSGTLRRVKRLKVWRRNEGMGEWLGTSIWKSDLRVLVGPQLTMNQFLCASLYLSLEN